MMKAGGVEEAGPLEEEEEEQTMATTSRPCQNGGGARRKDAAPPSDAPPVVVVVLKELPTVTVPATTERRRPRTGRESAHTTTATTTTTTRPFAGRRLVKGILSVLVSAWTRTTTVAMTTHLILLQPSPCGGFSPSRPAFWTASRTAPPPRRHFTRSHERRSRTVGGAYDDGDDDVYDDRERIDETQRRRENYYYEDEEDAWDRSRKRREKGVSARSAPDLEGDDASPSPPTRGGYYRVYFNGGVVDPAETQLDWESCSDGLGSEALVLLPPASVRRPTAVLHFVGGTFFGSAPKLWYRTFLEGVVRNTQAAVVVTPIPVTLFRSPLRHVTLAKRLRTALETAWYAVLEDEYGTETLQDVPLCGIGHSLGARLLTVLTTMDRNRRPSRSSSSSSGGPPPYKAMCLISFSNYGASAGIPGVATLLGQARRQEQKAKKNGEGKEKRRRRWSSRPNGANGARKNNDDDDGDDYYYYGGGGGGPGDRKKYRNGNDGNYDDNNYDDDEDEEDWAEVMDDLSELLREQADRVRTALTPRPEDLEFVPTPDELWSALGATEGGRGGRDGRGSRYSVNRTLVVQFDDDPIDQSSKLAQLLHDTNSSDVRFARLRGTHLTPVTAAGWGGEEEGAGEEGAATAAAAAVPPDPGWLDLPSRASATIWRAVRGRSKTRGQEVAMRDLRQSVVAYITEVVTK